MSLSNVIISFLEKKCAWWPFSEILKYFSCIVCYICLIRHFLFNIVSKKSKNLYVLFESPLKDTSVFHQSTSFCLDCSSQWVLLLTCLFLTNQMYCMTNRSLLVTFWEHTRALIHLILEFTCSGNSLWSEETQNGVEPEKLSLSRAPDKNIGLPRHSSCVSSIALFWPPGIISDFRLQVSKI